MGDEEMPKAEDLDDELSRYFSGASKPAVREERGRTRKGRGNEKGAVDADPSNLDDELSRYMGSEDSKAKHGKALEKKDSDAQAVADAAAAAADADVTPQVVGGDAKKG